MSDAIRLAIGANGVTAVLPGGRISELRGPTPADAMRAVVALARGAGVKRVVWSILPPLVDVRLIELPRLKPAEIQAVLEHHVHRYFPSTRGPQVVAWHACGSLRTMPVRVMVAVAPAESVEDGRAALEAAGLRVGDPVPAHEAWLAAALANDPPLTDGAVAVVLTDRRVMLRVEHGCLQDVAVLPSASPVMEQRLEDLANGGPSLVIGSSRDHPRDAGLPGHGSSQEGHATEAVVAAARYAGTRSKLAFVEPVRRAQRRRRVQKLTRWLWAVAGMLVLCSGALDLRATRKELAGVRAERMALSPAVEEVAAVRGRKEALRRQIALLDSVETDALIWSVLLTRLARQLPSGAYLTTLSVQRDSVMLEGAAIDAAKVFAALEVVDDLSEVRARAPIHRETDTVLGSVDRFSIAARFHRTTAADSAPMAGPGRGGS